MYIKDYIMEIKLYLYKNLYDGNRLYAFQQIMDICCGLSFFSA